MTAMVLACDDVFEIVPELVICPDVPFKPSPMIIALKNMPSAVLEMVPELVMFTPRALMVPPGLVLVSVPLLLRVKLPVSEMFPLVVPVLAQVWLTPVDWHVCAMAPDAMKRPGAADRLKNRSFFETAETEFFDIMIPQPLGDEMNFRQSDKGYNHKESRLLNK